MAKLIYKFITDANIKQVNDDERSFTAWASRSSMDRDDEEIDASGWITKDYRKNPVVPLFHDYHQFPIAKSMWEKAEPKDKPIGLLFKPIFAQTMLGEEVFYLYKEGFMNAFSVGFDPMEWMDSDGELHSIEKDGAFAIWQKGYLEQKKRKPRCRFLKQTLIEISGVLVPAHPDTLIETRSHIKTPELSKYLDDMINKERKTVIPVEIDYKQKYFESLEIISEQAQAILKRQKNTDVIDSQDFDDGIIIEDDDIDLDELLGSDGDALGDVGDISDLLVEISDGTGDDAERFNLEDY